MSDIEPKQYHYMSFFHNATGKTFTSWTFTLLKNGVRVEDIEINIEEVKTKYYVVSFKNDGTHNSVWQIFATEPSIDKVYTESWRVRNKTLEQNVQQIRSRLDSDGGFFNSQTDK